jgi:hypothetical protein
MDSTNRSKRQRLSLSTARSAYSRSPNTLQPDKYTIKVSALMVNHTSPVSPQRTECKSTPESSWRGQFFDFHLLLLNEANFGTLLSRDRFRFRIGDIIDLCIEELRET